MTEFCPTCKFFIKDTEPRDNGIGVCQRYPRLHLESHNCYYVDVVETDDWCGEWKASDEYILTLFQTEVIHI